MNGIVMTCPELSGEHEKMSHVAVASGAAPLHRGRSGEPINWASEANSNLGFMARPLDCVTRLLRGAITQRSSARLVFKDLEVANWCCSIDLIRNTFVQVRGASGCRPRIQRPAACTTTWRSGFWPKLFTLTAADALTVHGVPLYLICQEELCNPGRNMSINPNENSILTL